MSNTESFADLLVSHLPRLRAYAMSLTRNHAAAADLVQDTAFRVLRAESSFIAGSNFTAWTYRIMKNGFLSSLRVAKRTTVGIDDLQEEILAAPGRQENLVFMQEVLQAIDLLSETQQQAIRLVCAEGLSYGEAAATAQSTVGTIKSRLWRARKNMERVAIGSDFMPHLARTLSDAAASSHA